MKTYDNVVIPAQPERTEKVCVGRACDLCGLSVAGNEWTMDDWADTINETEVSITIKHRRGYYYDDGGSDTSYEIDICPTCFRERLIPWLRSQGAKIDEQAYDW